MRALSAGSEKRDITFEARIARRRGVQFVVTVRDGENVIASSMAVIDGPGATAAIAIREPKRWLPNHPNLYDAIFEIHRGGEVLDRVHCYFGIRSVGVRDGRVTLNGEPVYLKMVLDQG